jgi:hypothetical protein
MTGSDDIDRDIDRVRDRFGIKDTGAPAGQRPIL